MFAAVWGADESESSTTAQSPVTNGFGLGSEAESAARISHHPLSACGGCAATDGKCCHIPRCQCQLRSLKDSHPAAGLAWPKDGFAMEILCSWMAQEMWGLPGPLHTSDGATEKEPLASKCCAHSHWGCSAGSLRNLVLLFLQCIPTQSKVVSFNAVEHNYRPDRLWQVGWDIYSCSQQMLKWFCIGKCCLWNVLS